MQFTEGTISRVFILSFEDGDDVKKCIGDFCSEHGITTGYVNFAGLLGSGSMLRGCGGEGGDDVNLGGVYEGAAIGLIAPDENGAPTLQLNGSFAHGSKVISGTFNQGVKTDQNAQAVVYEISGTTCQFKIGAARQILSAATESPRKEIAAADTSKEKAPSPNHSHVIHLFNCSVN